MSPTWDEKTVFLTALALSGQDRDDFLRGACPDDESRARILALLLAHEETLTGGSAGGGMKADERTRPLPVPEVEQIDEFKIVRELGRGGMGVVYLAQDTLLQRAVAVKVLASHLTGSEQALGRFRDEAKTAALLRNPGIVPVYKFGFDGRRHYIVSEYVPGSTLKEMIALEASRRSTAETRGTERKAWRRRIAEIAARIAEALEHSHRSNVVHRDVKPSNILVGPAGEPRLTDFGIAKHLAPDVSMEFTEGLGSCHYMSPEQAAISGSKVDRRSDIFSLGVVLYEALALQKPFDGETPEQVLHAVRNVDPVPLRSLDPQMPRDLETICHKALEKSPDRRYQTAMHLEADLRCFLDGNPIMARPAGVGRRSYRWVSKHRVAFTIGLIAVLAGGLTLSGWSIARARSAALAWVSVDTTPPGLRVFMQQVDPATMELRPASDLGGETPLRHRTLPSGQYRITIVSPDLGSFLEFNALLLKPGLENNIVLIAREDGSTRAEETSSAPAGSPARVLRGVLRPTATIAGDDMVLIQEGEYEYGWTEVPDPVIGRRMVHVPSFFIDRTLVTNRAYKAFVDATGHSPPRFWTDYGYTSTLDDRPVVGISVEDAEAYARWRGKRLPTAIEWQAAARGLEKRRYPWGDDVDLTRAPEPTQSDMIDEQSWETRALYDLYARKSTPIGTADGMNHPLGLLNLFGPVRELTGSAIPERGGAVVVGRCWTDSPTYNDLSRLFSTPLGAHSFKHGFRCAKSASPAMPTGTGGTP